MDAIEQVSTIIDWFKNAGLLLIVIYLAIALVRWMVGLRSK